MSICNLNAALCVSLSIWNACVYAALSVALCIMSVCNFCIMSVCNFCIYAALRVALFPYLFVLSSFHRSVHNVCMHAALSVAL